MFLKTPQTCFGSGAQKEGVEVRVLHGVSFLDQVLAEISHDFCDGWQVVLPLTHLQPGFFTKRLALIVCQIEAASLPTDKPRVDLTMKFLLKAYPPDHPVTLIWTGGLPAYKTQSKLIALKDLVHEYGGGLGNSSRASMCLPSGSYGRRYQQMFIVGQI
jgi:uncharacterized protein YabN with tetrapyrrole methylase and pyrophosphatase domain